MNVRRLGTADAVLLLTGRFLRELGRERAVLVAVFALPVFFFLITALAYPRDPRPRTWTLAIDASLAAEPGLEAALREARHDDGRPAFSLRLHGAGEPVPEKTDLAVRPGPRGPIYVGDALSIDHIAAVNRFCEVRASLAGAAPRLVRRPAPYRTPGNDFEAYSPGMMVFAVLLLIPQTAMLVGREVRRGTMQRLRLTRLTAAGYLGGVAASQSAYAVCLGLVLLVLSVLFGFRFGGDPVTTAALTMTCLVLLGLSAVALGLVLSPFVKSDSSALNVGAVFTMLQVFLSGAFFPMPQPTVLQIGGVGETGSLTIGAYDAFPATHAMRALQLAMTGGGEGAAAPMALVLVLSLAWFAAAVVIFQRRVLRG